MRERFLIVTSRLQVRLDLSGQLVSWDNEHPTGLSEHRVNKQGGALHQDQGSPPQRFAFTCLVTAKQLAAAGDSRSLAAWYRDLRDVLTQQDPFCLFVHPRLGSLNAVCEGVTSKEAPGEENEAIHFTIKLAEDGLREPLTRSIASSAQVVTQRADVLAQMAVTENASVQAQVAVVVSAASAFVAVSELVAAGDAIQRLALASRTLADAVAGFAPDTHYRIRAQASLVLAAATDTIKSAQLGRPRLITHVVSRTTSVAELATTLYGGRLSRGMSDEILSLNHIPVPYRVPALSVLLVSDPTEVRRYAR